MRQKRRTNAAVPTMLGFMRRACFVGSDAASCRPCLVPDAHIDIACIPSLVFQGLQEDTRPGRLPVQAGRGEPHPRPLPADANRCMRCLRMRCSRTCPHLNIEMPLQWRQNQLNVTFNSQRRRCKAAQYIDGTMCRSIRRPAARCQRRPSPPHSSPEIGKPSDRTPAETGASLRQGAL